jgi:adenosylhomocysteine nucleosidase
MNKKQKSKITGLIFAMNEEKAGIEEFIQDKSITTLANRQFIQGNFWGHQVVCVLAGIGKVAAASTTALLLQQFHVNQLVLTGVAGATDEQLMVGDIIIADRLLQHDMNALPLFPRFEIPLLNKSYFGSDPILNAQLLQAAQIYIENDLKKHVNQTLIDLFQLHKIKIRQGLIASGVVSSVNILYSNFVAVFVVQLIV